MTNILIRYKNVIVSQTVCGDRPNRRVISAMLMFHIWIAPLCAI